MGMDVGGKSGGSMATPNVVPLIDILLVLIIIFMVITPLIPKGLDTLVPQPSPNQQQNVELENKTVVVQIAMNGKLKINNEDTTWDGLGPRMEQIFKERAEKIAFVKGDNDVMFMDVARAIDIMRGAGIDKIGLRSEEHTSELQSRLHLVCRLLLEKIYSLYNTFGLYDSVIGLILFHTAFALPFAIFLLRNFFIGIPRDLMEAARIDGASEIYIFLR